MQFFGIFFLSLALCNANLTQLFAQKYQINKSKIHFFSKAPIEDIEAINTQNAGVIDLGKGEFFFKIPIKGFKFEKELMQEHFNENYMESDKFPHSTFKGIIVGDYDIKKDGTYKVKANGDLTIHGVKKYREIPATILVKDGKPSIESTFMVKLSDHKIEIPTIMFNKIAEEIKVTISAQLKELETQP